MAKVSVNIPDDEKEEIDRFVEDNPNYSNRSEFIREAVKEEMDSMYDALSGMVGVLSDEEAEKARQRLEELDRESVKVQGRSDAA